VPAHKSHKDFLKIADLLPSQVQLHLFFAHFFFGQLTVGDAIVIQYTAPSNLKNVCLPSSEFCLTSGPKKISEFVVIGSVRGYRMYFLRLACCVFLPNQS